MEAQEGGVGSSLTPADIEARRFWAPSVTVTRIFGTRHYIISPDDSEEYESSFCNDCGFWVMKKTDDGLLLCAGCGERQAYPGSEMVFGDT